MGVIDILHKGFRALREPILKREWAFLFSPYDRGYAMLYALPVLRSRANCVGGCALLYAVCRLWLEERTPEQLKGET